MNKQEINEFSMRISQSSRTQIVVITYEIIINYLDSARESLDNKDETNFVFNVKKARQFLSQLSGALDFKYGISYELMNLYMYVNNCLVKNIAKRNVEKADSIKSVITQLRSSFDEISSLDQSGKAMKNRLAKRVLSFFLVLSMVFGSIPGMSMTAFAAEGGTTSSGLDTSNLTFDVEDPDGYVTISFEDNGIRPENAEIDNEKLYGEPLGTIIPTPFTATNTSSL